MVRTPIIIRVLIAVLGINSVLIVFALGDPGKPSLTDKELRAASKLNINVNQVTALKTKPLYEFTEKEIDVYLGYLQEVEPDLCQRVIHLGRKNIGQPYKIYLLGEFPFEIYDSDPLYCLEKSDCVVFCEHIYAMALAHDWPSFFVLLQRIRYKNGEIGMLTRNHDTIPDWDRNNSWLIQDITEEIGGKLTKPMTVKTNKRKFFQKWNLGQDVTEMVIQTTYIPAQQVVNISGKLKNADFVNVIRGIGQSQWCGHVGLIALANDGTADFLHSSSPQVSEQSLMNYVTEQLGKNPQRRQSNRAEFLGFKFFRVRQDALERLKQIDGQAGPLVTGPRDTLRKTNK